MRISIYPSLLLLDGRMLTVSAQYGQQSGSQAIEVHRSEGTPASPEAESDEEVTGVKTACRRNLQMLCVVETRNVDE